MSNSFVFRVIISYSIMKPKAILDLSREFSKAANFELFKVLRNEERRFDFLKASVGKKLANLREAWDMLQSSSGDSEKDLAAALVEAIFYTEQLTAHLKEVLAQLNQRPAANLVPKAKNPVVVIK